MRAFLEHWLQKKPFFHFSFAQGFKKGWQTANLEFVPSKRRLPTHDLSMKICGKKFLGKVNFYRRFLPNSASTLQPLTNLWKTSKSFLCTNQRESRLLIASKINLQILPNLPISSQMRLCLFWPTLPKRQLEPSIRKRWGKQWNPWPTFPSNWHQLSSVIEPSAVYMVVNHFRHLLEGRPFTVYTDHKPLIYAVQKGSDRYSPRELRHLDSIL